MSSFLKGLVYVLLLVRGGRCRAAHHHIGLDVSKSDHITLVTRGASSGKPLAHETFPNCVVVNCDDGSLHVPRDDHVCRSTSVGDSKICGILRGALMVVGLNEEDEPLENEKDESHHAKLSLDSDGELFYSVEAFPSKKIYLDQVVDAIFSALPRDVFESMATLMIPHDFLFEQRQAIVDSLFRSSKIQVTESVRFNPCHVSDKNECSASGHLALDGVSLDSVVLDHVNEKNSDRVPSHVPIASPDVEKQTASLLDDSAPSARQSGSTREAIERLARASLASDAGLYDWSVPSDVPSFAPSFSPLSVPSVVPTDVPSDAPSSVPSHAPSSLPSLQPTFTMTSRPSSLPSVIPSSVPTKTPSSMPSAAPSTSPSISPSSSPTYPTSAPMTVPLISPTKSPTRSPTKSHGYIPTHYPTRTPSSARSSFPTLSPSSAPSSLPTSVPTNNPTSAPTGHAPSTPTTSTPSTWAPTRTYRARREHGFSSGQENGEAGVLTAGEWQDTKDYSFWKTLVNCTGGAPQCYAWVEKKWNLCTGYPIAVSVSQLDEDEAVSDLSVTVFSESHMKMNLRGFGRTNVHGNTTVFLKIDDSHCNYGEDFLTDLRVSVQVERMFMGEFKVKTLKRENGIPSVHFVIDRKIKQENTLDLMFVTDTTGSMSDELSFLKSDLEKMIEVVQQACAGDTEMKIRTSVNFYRDVGDQYVVKGFPFDTDVKRNVKRVSAQFASGGGDFPEAVDRALEDALFSHKWSKQHGAKARLLFLILDAPPHSEVEVMTSLAKSMKRAQKLGVRLIPVTGSGIDKETEMLMRMFGLVTDGSYIHLTDDSGVGLSHVETKTTIPDHPVGKLLNVMVGTIRRYLGCAAAEKNLGATVQQ